MVGGQPREDLAGLVGQALSPARQQAAGLLCPDTTAPSMMLPAVLIAAMVVCEAGIQPALAGGSTCPTSRMIVRCIDLGYGFQRRAPLPARPAPSAAVLLARPRQVDRRGLRSADLGVRPTILARAA
jgi:hypothetical protein